MDKYYIPYTFICPISRKIMKNPYIDIYGHSYEYDFIIEYIKNNNKSPLNFKVLRISDMIPNRVLKNIIEEYKELYTILELEDEKTNIKWKNSEFCKNKTYYIISLYCNTVITDYIDYINSKFNEILVINEKIWIPEYDCKDILDKVIIYIKWKTNNNFRLKIYGELSQMYNCNISYNNLPILTSFQKKECVLLINKILESNDYTSLLDILEKVFIEIKDKHNLIWNKDKSIERLNNFV